MNQVKILIIEDEPDLGIDLQGQLEEIGYEVVGIAPNLEEAKALFDAQKPDIAIVDIMLDGQPDGIKFAQYLKNSESRRPVIFLTGMYDKATFEKAKVTTPAQYLLKPVRNIKQLARNIQLAVEQFEEKEEVLPDWFFFKKGKNFSRVNSEDILYVFVEGADSEIHISDTKYVTRCSLTKIEKRLGSEFIRTHNNYLVNINHVERFNEPDSQLFLTGNKPVPVSKRHRPEVKKRLNIF